MYIKRLFPVMHSLRDGEDLGNVQVDRGDEVVVTKDAPITDDEKKVAEDLKAAQEKKAAEDAEKAKKAAAQSDEEEEDDPDNPGKKRDSRIPLKRHKEILENERAQRARLEAQLAQFQRGEEVTRTNEELQKAENKLLEMEANYNKLIADGKYDEAGREMTAIRKQERAINDIRTDLKTNAAEARAYERARYDTTVERIEAAYPQLNEDNKNHEDPEMRFNPEIARKVLSVARAYQLDGMTPAAALQEAVKDIVGAPKTPKQREAVEVKARVNEAEVTKAKREEEARQKAAEAAGKQPAPINKGGKNSDTLGGSLSGADVMKMTYDDFSKLDEAQLSRMRGDIPE